MTLGWWLVLTVVMGLGQQNDELGPLGAPPFFPPGAVWGRRGWGASRSDVWGATPAGAFRRGRPPSAEGRERWRAKRDRFSSLLLFCGKVGFLFQKGPHRMAYRRSFRVGLTQSTLKKRGVGEHYFFFQKGDGLVPKRTHPPLVAFAVKVHTRLR